MVDVILLAQGETAPNFELALGLDREQPAQTALGLVTPVPLVPTTTGPPSVGATGWLCHLDAPNLLLHSLRPAPDGSHAIVARLQECGGFGGPVEFRCARNPKSAALQDAAGRTLMDVSVKDDAVSFEVVPNDLITLRIDFS
jgi:hypothetical protein